MKGTTFVIRSMVCIYQKAWFALSRSSNRQRQLCHVVYAHPSAQTTQGRTYTLLRNVCTAQALLAYRKVRGVRAVAIYHLHVSIVKRSSGRSSVAAAAYRAADKLRSERDGMTHDYAPKSSAVNAAAYRSGESLQDKQRDITHDYTRKRGVVHTEIMLPENAPQEYQDRATLWNAVEKAEKRKDAQTARDIDIALPVELGRSEQITLVREYVQDNFVDKGMCADVAIHDKGDGNPHAHILLTTREVTEKGFGKKNREWNSTPQLKEWREKWANTCNERLRALDKRIDHRTLEAQGINREPTIHVGVAARNMERKGIEHPRAEVNRGIVARNTARHMHELKEGYIALDKEISSLQGQAAEARREANSLRIKAEEITERAEQINAMRGRLDELRAGGRQSKQQAQQLERSENQATAYFKRTYNFGPEQAAAEAARLEADAMSKNHLHDKLREKATPPAEERETVLLEYQWQKLHADINPYKQEIYDHLAKLKKESRARRQSVQDDLTRMRCERALDAISWQNFQEIVKETQPEHAQALIERYELARERERMRTFSRVR